MQDRYTGDIGDFGKYGLLRVLKDKTKLTLGVNWYLTDPTHVGDKNNDGSLITYLDTDRHSLRECDRKLFDMLNELKATNRWDVNGHNRHVQQIEGGSIIDAVYFNDELSYHDIPSSKRNDKIIHREAWLKRSHDLLKGRDVIFLDPDNGIEPKSISITSRKAPKYVFLDDLAIYKDQSLIIYQHSYRNKSVESLKKDVLFRLFKGPLRDRDIKDVRTLQYHRGTSRLYIIIPIKKHAGKIHKAIDYFMSTPWKDHFSLVK